jgi:hypothetical protein
MWYVPGWLEWVWCGQDGLVGMVGLLWIMMVWYSLIWFSMVCMACMDRMVWNGL